MGWIASSAALLLSLSAVSASPANELSKRAVNGSVVVSKIPSTPPAGTQVIDAAYVSISIEFADWLEYSGNLSYAC